MKWEEAKDEFCIALVPYLPVLSKVSNDLIQTAEQEIASRNETINQLREDLALRNRKHTKALKEIARLREALQDRHTYDCIMNNIDGKSGCTCKMREKS